VNNKDHLPEDRITAAASDRSLLSGSEKAHLYVCPECSSSLAGLENDIMRFGKIAESYVPAPKKRFIVYSKKHRENFIPSFGIRVSLAALVIVLFFAITFHSDSERHFTRAGGGLLMNSLYSADLFYTEMNTLAEQSLVLDYTNNYGDEYYGDGDITDFDIRPSGDGIISETDEEGEIAS
jgi:hypothetical protein